MHARRLSGRWLLLNPAACREACCDEPGLASRRALMQFLPQAQITSGSSAAGLNETSIVCYVGQNLICGAPLGQAQGLG
eukprot:scaffold178176_cov44-Prasinocladus_malaysianus.AAC.1